MEKLSFDQARELAWRKNWAGIWTILECCSFGYQYTDNLKNVFSVGLEKVLFSFEKGNSANYIADEYLEAFGKTVAAQMQANPKMAETYARAIVHTANAVLDFIAMQPVTLSDESYGQLWSLLDEYLAVNFPMKKVVDFLPAETLETVLPLLEEARIYGEPVYAKSSAFVRRYAEQIAAREKINVDLLLCVSAQELERYIEKGVLPSVSELEERYTYSLILSSGKNSIIVSGEKARKMNADLLNAVQLEELRGKSAYPGKVRGRVRVVLNPSEIENLEKGTVLVTGMTRPEYLHLFKDAVAVITDAGGVLSHAAITARELKKPCIIGTERATSVLHDGDMVEVDAGAGTVRIID